MARSRKGPREPLSKERIELAALELIERDGLGAFSTRRLAQELRCEAMSIYHYFPSKSHLMDALADRVVAEIPPLPPKHLPWIDRVGIACRDYRAGLTKRPSLFIFMATFRMNTPTCLAYIDGIIGLFEEAGLGHEQAVRLFRAFGYYLAGAALDETAGYARGPSTAEPVPDEIMRRDFPHVVAAGRYFAPSEFDATFELGLDLLLAGAARLVEAQVGGASATVANRTAANR